MLDTEASPKCLVLVLVQLEDDRAGVGRRRAVIEAEAVQEEGDGGVVPRVEPRQAGRPALKPRQPRPLPRLLLGPSHLAPVLQQGEQERPRLQPGQGER